MRKSELIRHLEQLNADDLRKEVLHLFDTIPDVKGYYAMELGSESERLKMYKKAKGEIASKFATKSKRRPRRPRIQKLNLIISKLEKASIFPHEMIDIYLYTSESAINFKIDYNFKSTPLDNTIIKYFDKAIEQIEASSLQSEYTNRCQSLFSEIEYYENLASSISNKLFTISE